MPVFAAVFGAFILLRIAGTLQKHVFENLQGVKDTREMLRQLRAQGRPGPRRPKARAAWDKAVSGLQTIVDSWDWSIARAYDSWAEMLADVAALGVKIHGIKTGVRLGERLLKTLATTKLDDAVIQMINIIDFLSGGRFRPLDEALEDFARRYEETLAALGGDFERADPFMREGAALTLQGAELVGAGLGLIQSFGGSFLDPFKGLNILRASADLARETWEYVNALYDFALGIEEEFDILPPTLPPGEEPPPGPPPPPIPIIIPEIEETGLHGELIRQVTRATIPEMKWKWLRREIADQEEEVIIEELKTGLLSRGREFAGSLQALKTGERGPIFPFG